MSRNPMIMIVIGTDYNDKGYICARTGVYELKALFLSPKVPLLIGDSSAGSVTLVQM